MNTEIIFILLVAVVLALNIALVFILLKNKQISEKSAGVAEELLKKDGGEGMKLLLQHINDLSKTVDQKIGDSARDMNESLKYQSAESQKIIRDMTERLTKLDEANKQVVSLGDNIKELQNILKNPKQRGVLGEYYLETLLKNAMPPGSYQMQYNLGKDSAAISATGSGTSELVVDAVVFVKDKIIPIDSKFSLENYNRMASENDPARKSELQKVFINDLKERIKETSKYIRPEKGTLEFAFMFIPHEAIYYDLLVNKIGDKNSDEAENIIERAARQYKVIIVSATSFLAYLQTVLQGLKALQIEEETKDIIKKVADLNRHIVAQDKYMTSLGKTLGTTVNHYEKAYKELKKVDKDVVRIAGKGGDVEVLTLEKPEIE
jgi:DNA recombination protein RmuC